MIDTKSLVPPQVYLHAAPLCHIGGISSALAMLMAGATHVFLPRWRVDDAIAAVQTHHVTTFIAVPAMLADVIQAVGDVSRGPNEFRSPFAGIRTLSGGGRGDRTLCGCGRGTPLPERDHCYCVW